MLKHHAIYCWLFFLGAFVPLQISYGSPESSNVLTIYTEESFPLNYTVVTKEGKVEIAGYATELIKAILEHADLDYKIEMVPWRRAIRAIDSRKNVLVYSMTRSEEREKKYLWVGEILPLSYYLFGTKSQVSSLPKTLEEAKGSLIGTIRGDVVTDFLVAQGFDKLMYVSEPIRNLNALKRGRTELFPYNLEGLGSMLFENGFNPDEFVGVVKLEPISTGLYLALSKETDPDIFIRLQASYQAIMDSGLYESIFSPLHQLNQTFRVQTLDSLN